MCKNGKVYLFWLHVGRDALSSPLKNPGEAGENSPTERLLFLVQWNREQESGLKILVFANISIKL